MKPLAKRLARLESRVAWITRAESVAAVPSGAAVIAQQLADFGVVRHAYESLADTAARAMGLTNSELRAELERMAVGSAG